MWSHAGPGTIHAMQKTATILQNHGIRVEEASLPDDFGDVDTLTRSQNAIIEAEAAPAFLEEYRLDKDGLDISIRRLIKNHSGHGDEERKITLDNYAHLRTVFVAIAAQCSVIIAPSIVDEVPVGLGDMGSPVFGTMWTGLHVPVIHVPAFVGINGMPVGVSLIAGGEDEMGIFFGLIEFLGRFLWLRAVGSRGLRILIRARKAVVEQ